ncbi:hypothetical protein bcgnr5369_00750 [Bacillus cereus]
METKKCPNCNDDDYEVLFQDGNKDIWICFNCRYIHKRGMNDEKSNN